MKVRYNELSCCMSYCMFWSLLHHIDCSRSIVRYIARHLDRKILFVVCLSLYVYYVLYIIILTWYHNWVILFVNFVKTIFPSYSCFCSLWIFWSLQLCLSLPPYATHAILSVSTLSFFIFCPLHVCSRMNLSECGVVNWLRDISLLQTGCLFLFPFHFVSH